MPSWFLVGALERIGRLRAEESLEAVDRIAVGTGSCKKEARSKALAAWQRQASPPRKARSLDEIREAIRAMPLPVRRVPAKGGS